MPSTDYVDFQGPVVNAEWLNEVNDYVFPQGVGTTPSGGTQDAMTVLIESMGYNDFVPYAAGLTMNSVVQTVLYQGVIYAPNLVDLPFTTGGAFEAAKFTAVELTTQFVATASLAASTGAAGVGSDDGASSTLWTTLAGFVNLVKGWMTFGGAYPGASVPAKLDAAVAASAGRLVIIPPSMGAGEPTSYPVGSPIIDLRGSVAAGSGRKTIFDFSDANGSNVLSVINDMVNPPLSHSAVLAVGRASGVLPANRNIEGLQAQASVTGAVTGGNSGYIVSGGEFGADTGVGNSGGQIGYLWGAHAGAIANGNTPIYNEICGLRILNVANNGTATPIHMWGLIVDDVSGTATNKGAALFKGNVLHRGDVTVNRAGTVCVTQLLSGGATLYSYLDIGRTGGDFRIAVAGAANDFIAGCAQGDAMAYMPAAKALWLGANSAFSAKVSSLGVQCLVGFYPPDEDGTLQAVCGHLAGSGAPNNTNGANGDFYFRSDGTVAGNTVQYHKEAGAWVALVTA